MISGDVKITGYRRKDNFTHGARFKSIRKQGAFICGDCHKADGVLDWKALGYSEDEVRKLQVIPLR